MIHPHEITIGSLIRTNTGEIIRVEGISTKRKHRKVGYHTPDDPCRIKYVRLAQCEGIELTPEILEKNGLENRHDGSFVLNEGEYLISFNYYSDVKTIRIICHTDYFCNDVLVYGEDVHQLQFALICAGLPELAMKLKIAE
ncbi:MAG: hypothetical protein MJZ30_05850 [Paludibacteraceae bacterium]|nr:hypothetical protein [Paludibacteraceae bacterium]